MEKAKTIIVSILLDKRLVFYGLFLLVIQIVGVLLFYDRIPEYDILPHLWFGYVLSEYTSKGANSLNLQSRLTEKFQQHGWPTANPRRIDFLLRFAGFLLIGGLFWESAELFVSPLIGRVPDSFFAFPITLSNIDGAIDVAVGALGATVAFFIRR